MSRYPNNRIYLGIEIHRTTQDLYGNAVLLDLVLSAFEILFTNERKQSNEIVGSSEHP